MKNESGPPRPTAGKPFWLLISSLRYHIMFSLVSSFSPASTTRFLVRHLSILLTQLLGRNLTCTFIGIQSSSRQGLILLYCIQFLIFGSTYAQFIVAAAPDSATAGIIATVLFALCLGFNGVFQPPNALPGFWLFMYRVSPLTYFVGGMASTTLHALPVVCSSDEIAVFRPPGNLTCGTYLQKYIELGAPGQLLNGSATTFCEWCSFRTADQVLAISEIQWGDRWRNFGILFSYIGFNIAACVGFYYVFRVKQWRLKRNQ
jgi:ATP-binding cassette subfamily G (WHITE) protein 2 (PDR)